MKKIIILKGLPASGKSTWAKKQVAEFPSLYKRINKDDLRAMLDDSKWSKQNERFVLRVRNMMIEEALQDGFNPIVDDTNFNPIHEDTIKKIADKYPDVSVEVKMFDTPLAECLARDKNRANSVGEKVIRDMWIRYLKPKPKAYQPGLPEIILCDIDGTIAQMNGRSPYDESKVKSDIAIKPIIEILNTFKRQKVMFEIVLMSGRHDSCREDTESWLRENNVNYDHLFMRGADDNRPDYIIKKELYEKHIQGKFNVLFVLDDRTQVVDLWRSIGLKCLQVDYGDF